jgi:hypothetical protein
MPRLINSEKQRQRNHAGKNPVLTVKTEDELRILFRRSVLTLLVFTIFMLLLTLIAGTCSPVSAIITLTAVAAGCAFFGASIGFLFGIPRLKKDTVPTAKNGVDEAPPLNGSYTDNTNLEEISDWLTKIILGLTLVELKPILSHIATAATNFSNAYSGYCNSNTANNYYPFAFATIVFYFLIGCGLSYLWTRSSLLSILEERRLRQVEKLNQKLNARTSDLYDKLSAATKVVNRDTATSPTTAGSQTVADIVNPVQNAGEAAITVEDKDFRKTIKQLYEERPIRHEEDLQKDRWGGKSISDNIALKAKYNPSLGASGFFGIDLTVEALADDATLGSEVAFFLHDTFPREIDFVKVENNKATNSIRAFEAFVVAARTQSGIELELDLNKVKGFPRDFYY